MKHISESKILQKFTPPPGGPPPDPPKQPGSIAVFPISPLDLPSATFENALKRREKNHRKLIQWIQKNLEPDVDYGRTHIQENCRYARANASHLCRDFSHMSMITLWKAGAEKLIRLMGLSVHFPTLREYELACVHRQEIQMVVLKCELRTSSGNVVAEGAGARHIRQHNWDLNATIKVAAKSAMVDATIRAAGLTGIFIKTHRHTVKNNRTITSDCHNDNLTSPANRNGTSPRDTDDEKFITLKQIDLIKRIAGRKGMTTEALTRLTRNQFSKTLDNLNRVEASKFIQHING